MLDDQRETRVDWGLSQGAERDDTIFAESFQTENVNDLDSVM